MGEAKAKFQNIMKYTQLLLSLSLFSFLFSSSSSSSLLAFLHYFNSYFSSFTFQLFSHTIDKNCIFLLCNGLLVFLGITRSFSGSTSPNLDEEEEEGACRHNIEKESEVKISGIDEEVEEEEEGKGSGEVSLKEMEEEADDEEETGILEEKEEKMSENGKFVIEENIEEGGEEEEKEVVEEENWRLSTEEMNKKFEDFIRRMKEDLRIEAQRQVVMI